MATTINSGYANSPKLTANIADHADVFGGRGLIFDGVTDYLSLADSISLSGQFTISMWVYLDDNTSINLLGDSSSSANFMWIDANSDIQLASSDLSITFTDSNMTTSSWQNILVTRDGSNVPKFYNNGALIQTLSADAGTFSFNQIGTYHTGSNFFNGKMSDVKIFNTALTESQVTELYRKPENTPSAVQDNLVAWYPMIEGNPESPQSIVYDHSEKKLGSDTFGGLNQFVAKGSVETVEVSGDELTLTIASGNDAGMNTGNLANLGLSTSLGYAVGDLVKLQFEAKIVTNGSGFGETVRWYDVNGYVFSATNISLTSEYQTFTFYGAISNLGYSIPSFLRMGNRTGTDVYKLKNFSVQKVLMGNHATTNFFGDDLQTGTWNNSDLVGFTGASADGFTAVNTDASVGNDDNAYGDEISFVAGKTYQMSFTLAINSGSIGSIFVGVTSGTAGSADSILSYTLISSANNYSYTFTPTSTVTRRPSFRFVVNGTYNFTISNFEIKEVGISSSGFETAVNEPVVPQVPLMRYNQKAIFYRNKNNYVSLTEQTLGANTAFTISFSFTPFADQEHHMIGKNSTDDTIRIDTAPAYGSRVHVRINGSGTNFTGLGNINVNESAFYTVTRTTGGVFSVYRNGVKSSTSLTSTTDFKYQYLGQALNGAWESDGLLNEFSIFNTHFSDSQVQELFNDGVTLDATTHSKASALRAYWRNDGVTTWKNRGDKFASFDGVNDIITRNAINVDYKSVSVWVRPNTTITSASSGSELMFFGNWDFGSCRLGQATGDFTNELITLTDNHGGGTKKTGWIPSSGETIPNDSWTHIAFIWDGSKYVIYYNGQPQTVVTASNGHAPLNTNKNIRIGTGGANSSSFFGGDITGVAFWSESLTDAQVLSIYNAGQNGNIASIQSSDLELYYTFNPHASTDADTNSSVQDRSGNNRDSTSVSGAVIDRDGTVQGSPDSITIREGLNSNRDGLGFYFTNPSSNVLRLNGIDEHLKLPYTKSFDMGDGSFTVCAWVKTTLGVGDSIQTILWARDNDDSNKGFEFQIDDGSDRPRFILSDGSATECLGTNNSVESNKWHFVAVVVDKENDLAKIFLSESDGSALKCQTTIDISARGNINATPDWYIGKRKNNTSQDFMGIIDELMVYNIALTALESDGTTVEAGDTVTSGELLKNYKFSKGKHKND